MSRRSSPARHHEKLSLENFTCFQQQTLEFVEGVNVYVGENGTGKTHAMKALYAFQKAQASRKNTTFPEELRRLFQLEDLSELVSKGTGAGAGARVAGLYRGQSWEYVIQKGSPDGIAANTLIKSILDLPVFIPAIDMMGHSKGFMAASNFVPLDFDSACTDILNFLSTKRKTSGTSDMGRQEVEAKLREIVPGEIEIDEQTQRYELVNDRGRFSMPMVAEGIRKVAALRKLVENNWIERGTTLFWDEPEVNLNPKIMDEVVEALWLICRRGVQIFIASHSYLILKELEVQQKHEDSLRYFAFECAHNGTVIHPSDTYLDLYPNPIEEQYAHLYDASIQKEIQRASGGGIGA